MNTQIKRAFQDALEEGVFPSAEVLAACGDEIHLHEHFGAARQDTCFDIASLTKSVSSATIAMTLVAEKLLKLDDNVYDWLGGARQPAHRAMTIRMLLNHTSGLPAWDPYYRELPISLIGTDAGRRMILDACFRETPVAEPGTKTIYSDIGYILLGEILEQAGGAPLEALFAQHVSRPLDLTNTFFIRQVGAPLSTTSRHTTTHANQHVPAGDTLRGARTAGVHRRFAPTEDCPWRERVVHGEVHDPNAYALGGVAGHAGLFSTATDLHRFALELTRCYRGESDWIEPAVVRTFLEEHTTKPTRESFVLGWNRPSKRNSASGHHFSPNTVGFLGYTGCSIWIDLTRDCWIILLTNRVHPSDTNQKIKIFRPMIHDLITSTCFPENH